MAKQAKFKAKYGFPFTLLSDPDGRVCEAYGVMVDKSMYGKIFRAIERTTVVIAADGMIERIYRKVKVDGHAHAVLEDLSSDGGKALPGTQEQAPSEGV